VESFFERPILNSPYLYPGRHWELDEEGQPTNRIVDNRRRCELITPVPKPQKRRRAPGQGELGLRDGDGLSTPDQEYEPTSNINEIRGYVAAWRSLPNPNQWQVTPETARLLQHWRHHQFNDLKPFFCQIEAVETAIWLAEVASERAAAGARIWTHIRGANKEANPELLRIALKLATGAGKTTVMAMLIAWQTVNAVRHSGSQRFSRAFLVITPGITIKDRLRVLQSNDPNSYYRERELVPSDMLGDIERAKIVITNYHAFRRRERMEVSKTGRALLQGRGPELNTLETEGQMLQRACGDLMGLKHIVALNDEAHHCYREKPQTDDAEKLKGEDKEEARKNNEAARLWISGIETVKRKLGLAAVYDLSATPFFLRGSGYAEGTLFPWTVSDFSLMDAIECGIVKLPRVPIADNIPGGDMPKFRELWKHVGPKMPKKGRGKSGNIDPLSLPNDLQTALEALYGHYAQTSAVWEREGIGVPPVFIVVCNNTSTSKLVYDFISGFNRKNEDESETYVAGRLEQFRNYDEYGNRLARPRTLLIDSEQLESGEEVDKAFRDLNADAIERFRRDIVQRTGDIRAGDKLSDQALLREVMNTVGKPGQLGESIRCVVSVSMLTEGWDVSTVTHILGVRAFGTQLLCEQVVGRALRRQSYDQNEEGLLSPEYADVLGIPFDFTAKPVVAPPTKPRKTVRVEAVRPDRDALQITFPRVEGYRVELPEERLMAKFTEDSMLELTPELVGPTDTTNRAIIGKPVNLTVRHLADMRQSEILYRLTVRLLFNQFRDTGQDPKLYLFGQLKRIAREWLDGGYLRCTGGTYPAQLIYQDIADRACERIKAAITESMVGEHPVKAVLDPYNPTGSTAHVRFDTLKTLLWETAHNRCHVNRVVCDGNWEAEFCRAAEANPHVRAYVKNQGLGFEVPYLLGATSKKYLPDFIVRVDDGHGSDDLLNLVVEIKGYRGENAKDKANTMDAYWVPGVNNLGTYGRWAFAEFKESVYAIAANFDALIERAVAGNAD
jgi:type III restriction enzyme